MPEKVSYDSSAQIIRVISWGKCSIKDWESSRTQVLQLNSEHGCNKLLVDVRNQESAPGKTAVFHFGECLPRTIRIAIVMGAATREDQKFLETVAVNRGIPLKGFSNETEASEWLDQ